MKAAIVQHEIRERDVEWTLQHISALMDGQTGADLYVLPEMFATGFMAEGAEEFGQRILNWMLEQARRRNAAIAGSVAAFPKSFPQGTDLPHSRSEQLLRNRLYFVRPDGSYEYYDKRHLFSYAGEQETYAAGERRVVVEWQGVRFLLQVCYDLRFPVFSRNRDDYDAIIYVANWPQKRREVWQTLLKARALENQCFVIGVNIVGNDKSVRPIRQAQERLAQEKQAHDKQGEYVGDSVIHDAYGHTIAQCTPGKAETAAAELDMNELQRFREKFPVLRDRD